MIHSGELPSAEIHHLGRKAAALFDPAPYALGINIHQQLRRGFAHHRPAVVAGIPGRVETKPGPRRDANTLVRDDPEHHGAGRQAGTIDDDPLAGVAQSCEVFKIGPDLPPQI